MINRRLLNGPRFGFLIAIQIAFSSLSGCGSGENPKQPISGLENQTRPKSSTAGVEPEAGLVVKEPPQAEAIERGSSLRVFPETFKIPANAPGLQLQAIKVNPNGTIGDLTRNVQWRVEPPQAGQVDTTGFLRPELAWSGQLNVKAKAPEGSASTFITVERTQTSSWSFADEIVPILTKLGCNTGGCHGKADGQNGFHLSLFGYDPEGDYRSIARDLAQRRISTIQPRESLLLNKATAIAPHGGGQRLRIDSPEYRRILGWIASGAPENSGVSHGRIVSLRVEPPMIRLAEPGAIQVRVLAKSADGHEQDVSQLSIYRTLDDSAATVTPAGRLTLKTRTETDLVVRFGAQVLSARISTAINPGLTPDFSQFDRRNFIDEELFKRLEALEVPASPRAADATFLRRASLDITGQQPTPQEVREFLADADKGKRSKLIDRLLDSPEFVLFWRIKVGDLLQISRARQGDSAFRYLAWVDQSLRKNRPWDEIVRTLLTAVGDPNDIDNGGPVNYALDSFDPKIQAEQTAQRFLGLRLRCAQCHDHPFDIWTQDDYYGMAAFFAKVGPGGMVAPGMMAGKRLVSINPEGSVLHLRTGKPASPKQLDGTPVKLDPKADPRRALADWIVSPSNPFFARAIANWTWAQFFGKGLVDPPDDMSRANPAVHPELLDALARHFVDQKFDLKDLIRTIATSEAYGLSAATVPGNESDVRLFSHQIPRPLSAHQMADALAQATDVPNRYNTGDQAARTKDARRSIDLVDPMTSSLILDTFGRCSRTVACASVSSTPLSLRQSLLLIGGDVIESKITNLNGYLANTLKLELEPGELVENLYYRTVCRPPTSEELSRWTAELKQAPALNEAAEDLFWSLLNSREFAFNH